MVLDERRKRSLTSWTVLKSTIKIREREQPTRQLVDNRKLLARTKAVRQTTGRAPTELILPGQD
jgi:hypothetical protein